MFYKLPLSIPFIGLHIERYFVIGRWEIDQGIDAELQAIGGDHHAGHVGAIAGAVVAQLVPGGLHSGDGVGEHAFADRADYLEERIAGGGTPDQSEIGR